MGRWTQYDEVCIDTPSLSVSDLLNVILQLRKDEYRLPEGMKRVGYDADTGRYAFQDSGGGMWQGRQGENFGVMTPGTFNVNLCTPQC